MKIGGALRATSHSILPAAVARQATGAVGGPWTVVSASLGNALTGALVEDPDLFVNHRVLAALTSPLRRDALAIRGHLEAGDRAQAGAVLGGSAGQVSGALTGATLATRWALQQTPTLLAMARQLPLPPEFSPWVPLVVNTASVGLAQMVGGTLGGWVGQAVGRAVGFSCGYDSGS